jgi:tRNA G18 (ribose-2'-O)-methylase SpoU
MKVAVLDNLRSVYNVGSIFRTCNACGIEKVYLCGTTPTPLDKKGLKRKDFAKVALGAEDTINWEYKEDVSITIQELKEEKYYIIAIEQDKKSVDYKEVNISGKEKAEITDSTHGDSPGSQSELRVAFVIGSEVDGVTHDIVKISDVIAEIPMLGTKESLNVTIAFGIAVYRILGV